MPESVGPGRTTFRDLPRDRARVGRPCWPGARPGAPGLSASRSRRRPGPVPASDDTSRRSATPHRRIGRCYESLRGSRHARPRSRNTPCGAGRVGTRSGEADVGELAPDAREELVRPAGPTPAVRDASVIVEDLPGELPHQGVEASVGRSVRRIGRVVRQRCWIDHHSPPGIAVDGTEVGGVEPSAQRVARHLPRCQLVDGLARHARRGGMRWSGPAARGLIDSASLASHIDLKSADYPGKRDRPRYF